jgi:FkbM family methyltransferase
MSLDISNIIKIHIVVLKRIKNRTKWFLLRKMGQKGVIANVYRDFKLYLEFTDDPIEIYYLGIYEPEETRMIKSIVKEGMTVIDIGANIGYFSMLMANLVGPRGKVYSFEPNPKMFRRLQKNIEINTNLSGQITINQVAIGEKEGKANFFCPPPGSEGLGGLKDTKRISIDNVINVDVITLDKFIDDKNVQKLDFIKLDVEGGEFDVLKGAKGILNKYHPTILFEGEEENTTAYNYRVFQLLSYLENLGYIVKKAGNVNFIAIPSDCFMG